MRLNDLKPGKGARQTSKRLGRGIGSGLGKTGGRGHKGQKSRSGGFHKVGFEGGQMPLQRRLPKRGFRSRMAAESAELRLDELAKIDAETVTIDALKAAHLVPKKAKKVKLIASGKIDKAVKLSGIHCTKGALAALEAAGGSAEPVVETKPASKLKPKNRPASGDSAEQE